MLPGQVQVSSDLVPLLQKIIVLFDQILTLSQLVVLVSILTLFPFELTCQIGAFKLDSDQGLLGLAQLIVLLMQLQSETLDFLLCLDYPFFQNKVLFN